MPPAGEWTSLKGGELDTAIRTVIQKKHRNGSTKLEMQTPSTSHPDVTFRCSLKLTSSLPISVASCLTFTREPNQTFRASRASQPGYLAACPIMSLADAKMRCLILAYAGFAFEPSAGFEDGDGKVRSTAIACLLYKGTSSLD